jgi:hypothetical protein
MGQLIFVGDRSAFDPRRARTQGIAFELEESTIAQFTGFDDIPIVVATYASVDTIQGFLGDIESSTVATSALCASSTDVFH